MYASQQRTWSPLQYTKQQPTLTQDQLEPPLLPPHHCAPSAPLPPSPPPFLRDCVIQGCSPFPTPAPSRPDSQTLWRNCLLKATEEEQDTLVTVARSIFKMHIPVVVFLFHLFLKFLSIFLLSISIRMKVKGKQHCQSRV